MDPVPTFKVSSPEWVTAVQDWAVATGLGIVDTWRYHALRVASALTVGYEPGGRKGWNQSTPPNDRKQGEGALVRDIHRAVFPLLATGFRDVKVRKKVRKAVADENVPALAAMVRAGAFGQGRRGMTVLPAGNEWTAHQRSRKSRGRVLSKRPNFATVGNRYLKEYIREAKPRVGQARGGWAKSLLALGGKVPGWIERHSKAGKCTDNLKVGTEPLSFIMINRSQWAGDGEAERITQAVLGNRSEQVKADMAFLIERGWTRDARGRVVR